MFWATDWLTRRHRPKRLDMNEKFRDFSLEFAMPCFTSCVAALSLCRVVRNENFLTRRLSFVRNQQTETHLTNWMQTLEARKYKKKRKTIPIISIRSHIIFDRAKKTSSSILFPTSARLHASSSHVRTDDECRERRGGRKNFVENYELPATSLAKSNKFHSLDKRSELSFNRKSCEKKVSIVETGTLVPIEINYELDRAYTLEPFRYMCAVMRREIIRVDWHNSRRVLLDEPSGFIGRGQQGRVGMYANFSSRLHTEKENIFRAVQNTKHKFALHIWHILLGKISFSASEVIYSEFGRNTMRI